MINLLILLLLSSVVKAEDFYVSQTGGVTTNGTSCVDAKPILWANTVSSWGAGAGKISAGDTVHLCGVLGDNLNILGNGSAGNYITILFESGASFKAGTWPQTGSVGGAVCADTKSHFIVDGGVNGLITATNSGTGLTTNVVSLGINGTSCTDWIVKNLEIGPMYVRTNTTDSASGAASVAIQNTCKFGTAWTDFMVTNCVLHDAITGMDMDYAAGCARATMANCIVTNCNFCVRLYDRSIASTWSDLTLIGNTFKNWTVWDGTDAPSQASFHHNGLHLAAVHSGTASNTVITRNIFGPNWSAVSPNGATAGIQLESFGIWGTHRIDNNIFLHNSGDYAANGDIFPHTVLGLSSTHIIAVNNTHIGGGVGQGFAALANAAETYEVTNNIYINDTAINFFNVSTANINVDYNDGYNLISGQAYGRSATASSNFRTFAQWQSLGYDAHGFSTNPNLDSNYRPQTGSPAIGSGYDLSSIFTTDYYGSTRTPPWTVGAANGLSCTYSIDSNSATANTAGAITSGSSTVTVTAGTGCTWTSVSNVGWLTVTSGSSGTGNGTTTYTVSVNTGVPRSGTLTIAGYTFTVSQAGVVNAPVVASGNVRVNGNVILK